MPKRSILPSVEELHRLFRYDGETGKLYWKISPAIHVKVGDEAGRITSNGYLKVTIKKKNYAVHRIIYKMFHKVEPPDYLDHINEVKTDNRIENLREIDNGHNNRRSKKGSGVSTLIYYGGNKRYRAEPNFNGKHHYLGYFDTFEEARKKVIDWELETGVRRD